MIVEFDVPFVAGQKRPRFVRATGRTYKDDSDSKRERRIAAAYVAAGGVVLDGPVAVLIDCWRPLPKSRPKRVESEPNTLKPDADNVAKLVLDALNGVAYRDDAQVVVLRVTKHDRMRECARECTSVRVTPARECIALVGQDLEDFDDMEAD